MTKSGTNPSTATSTNSGTVNTECGGFFTNATPGNHKPRSTVNHFGAASAAHPPRQAVLLLRQRMGADRPAHRHPHDRAHARVSKLRAAATATRRNGHRHRLELPRRAATGAVLSEDVFALSEIRRGRRSPCWAVPLMRRQPRGGQSRQRQRLRQPPDCLALERRPRTGANRADRLQHQREEHRLVPLSVRHRTAGRLDRSHQSPLQRRFAATLIFVRVRLHAHLLAEPGELFQSCILLVSEPVRPDGPAADSECVSNCSPGQRRQCALHHAGRPG